MLPHFIRHYRKAFPSCKIVIYDNISTDQSWLIGREMGCEMRTYDTGGKLDDMTYLKLKNNVWKDADTDWVIVCDVDEHFCIDEKILQKAESKGQTVIKSEGWNLVNLQDDLDIQSIETGIRAPSYDKMYCFNKRHIKEVNYSPGCHGCSPSGNFVLTPESYILKHYKYININYMIERHALFASRMSDNNKKKGMGIHYTYSPERIRQEFENARLNAQIVL